MTDSTTDSFPLPSQNTEPRYAGFWIRVGAAFIDILVLSPLLIYSFFEKRLLPSMVLTVAIYGYKPLIELILSQTIGKKLLGLVLVTKDFVRIGFLSVIIRNALLFAWLVPLVIYGIRGQQAGLESMSQEAQAEWFFANLAPFLFALGLFVFALVACIVAAFTARKRGLHDMLADSFVVYKESLPRT